MMFKNNLIVWRTGYGKPIFGSRNFISYQDWGEEMHHSFILKRIETLKDDMKEKIKLLEDEKNDMKERIQSLENDIKAMNTLMKGRKRLKKMKAKKGRKVLKTMK